MGHLPTPRSVDSLTWVSIDGYIPEEFEEPHLTPTTSGLGGDDTVESHPQEITRRQRGMRPAGDGHGPRPATLDQLVQPRHHGRVAGHRIEAVDVRRVR